MTDSQLMHVLLVSGRDQVTDWLMSTLRAEKGVVLAGWAPSQERAVETVGQRRVDLVLLDTLAPDAKQLERLHALAALPMAPAVILLVDPGEVSFVQQALFAGARGFLLKPFTERQLTESLQQTFAILSQQRQAAGATPDGASCQQSAQILAVFSPKSGIGCTSLATNLAVALHQEAHKLVTLVDGDVQFGDVDIAVNAIAHTSIGDLLGYVNELEPSLIESALQNHPSGIRLLLAPALFDPSLEYGEGQLPHIVKALAATQREGYVIVDTPAGLGENSLGLLDVAQRVLLVTTGTLASLRAAKRFLELTHKMEYPLDKIVMVVSGYRKDTDLPLEDIERLLSCPVTGVVPSDPIAMAMALSQGQPILTRDKNHAVSKAIVKLARQLAGGTLSDATQKPEPSPSPSVTDKRSTSLVPARFSLRVGEAL
jgi:pilus assembly protein CpaE